MNRIPTLDGWRGIAIALVLFDHVQSALLRGYLRPWTETGQHGVTIFFVLSGFLITTKLMEGTRNFKRFYIRRFFRLMPAAWAYLAALWAFDTFLCGHRYITLSEIASCVFFYRNYLGHHLSVAAGHFWSLSLEEQFYLVWPVLLGFLSIRRCRWIAVAGIAACTLWRATHWAHYDRLWYNFHTEVRADALLVGCLLAMAMADARVLTLAAKFARWWALPAFTTFALCVYRFPQLPPLIESLSIAGMIAATVIGSRSSFVRWLEWRPLAWLGTISYSIYVWQQFFFLQFPRAVSIELMCLMPLFALASYYWIERPATRLGHWLTNGSKSSRSIAPVLATQQT